MFPRTFLITFTIAFFLQLTFQAGFIRPLSPLEATFVNCQLPSIYNFHFNLSSGLRSDSLLRIQFPNYTTLGAPTCLFSINQTSATDQVSCSAISNSVYIRPNTQLSSHDSIHTTVFLSQNVPNSPGYTDLIEVSTVSSTDPLTAIIFDINPGFGNMFWQPFSTVGRLFVQALSLGDDTTAHLQGAVNSISVHIRFNKGFTAEYARLLVILDRPWAFGNITLSTERSPLYAIAVAQGQPTDLYLPTSIRNFGTRNSQVLEIFFNESLVAGREFILNIDGIINPLSISQGKIRFYATEYTSNYVLESNENIILYTAENNLNINITLASGIPIGGPVQLYKNAQQYLQISFLVDADLPAGATIKYQFPNDNSPVKGTFSASSTLQDKDNGALQYTIAKSSITLTNLGAMRAGSIITILTKMQITRIWSEFYTVISISYDNTIIRYGESKRMPLTTNANSMVTFFGDSNNENLVIQTAASAQIVMNLRTTAKEVNSGATLEIYTTKYVDGPATVSCSSPDITSFSTCAFANNGNYTKITMSEIPISNNLNINIQNLAISKASNHQQAIYEFYMRVDKDGTGIEFQDLMISVFVRPPRNRLTEFLQYHINNIGSNTEENYPSFLRMFGSQSALNSLSKSDDEDLILTVYGFNNIVNYLDVTDGGAFPCGGSIPITCQFLQGGSNLVENYPLDWSRVIITLPSAIIYSAFNLYIPQFFADFGAQTYEFMLGTYNKKTRIYENLYIQNKYTANPTQDTDILTRLNATTDLYIDITGQQAGVLVKSPIPISFSTNMVAAGATEYGAATVLVTAWKFWNSDSLLQRPATPLSILPQDATVFLEYKTTGNPSMNAVIWPMVGSGAQAEIFNAFNVEMPYSLDIPNYIMFVTDSRANFYAYNSLINTGRNALSSTSITTFNFQCDDMVQGFLNTYCSIVFTPNAKIDLQTKMKIAFSNAFSTISQCTISYTPPGGSSTALKSSDFSCSSSLSEIQLAFNLQERLPIASFNFSFLGLDHRNGTDNSLTFTIFDDNFGYIIETAIFTYFLELKLISPITIDQLKYDFINLDSISNLRVHFTLPRHMQSNEVLEFDIGADLQGNNKNTKRLAVFLTSATNTAQRINLFGALKNQILRLQFDEGVLLNSGSYILNLDNLKTPSTHSTNHMRVILRRDTDNVFVLESNLTQFTAYPVLQLAASAQIELTRSRFLCTGCLGEFVFKVTLATTYLDQYTRLYLHMPSFFLPALANDEAQPACWFNLDPINCQTDPDYPYRLDISNTPLALKPGQSFDLTIYGFIVPNAEISFDEEEDIFFAIASPSNPGTYLEHTFLSLPELSLIQSGLVPMFLYALTPSNTTIKQESDYTFRVNTTAAIPAGSQITVTFTEDFVNLRYRKSVPCTLNTFISSGKSLNYTNANCQIIGATVQFEITKNIISGSSLEIIIRNIPNPVQAMTVDPNEFIIAAFKSDGVTMIAVSKDSLNSASVIDFIDPMNVLQANNNHDILLTRGTYSQNIFIGTTGSQRFVQDVSIIATVPGFVFTPSFMDFYVGDISSTFKVGCDQNIKVRTYPFAFPYDQDVSLINAYGDMFNLRVTVTDDPILIEIPETIKVPFNAYSVPYEINLQQVPFKNMQILTIIDDEIYHGALGMDGDYSATMINFTSTKGIGYLAFYSTRDIANLQQPLYVDLMLDGDNFEAYKLSRNRIKIEVDNTEIPRPVISGNIKTVGKTEALFEFNYNTKGMAIFQLSHPCAELQEIQMIKNMLMNNSFNDLEMNTNGCYQKYFVRVLNDETKPYTLNITGLTPETTFDLHVYFENQKKQNNSQNVLSFSFSTTDLNPIVKMTATFTPEIYIDQLNDFICFLLKLFQTRATFVVDAQGYSCSSYIEPTSRFLTFQGASYANYSNSFSFFLLPDPKVEFDASSLKVPVYFDAQTKQALPNLYDAAKANGINFLTSLVIDYQFTQQEALNSADPIIMPSMVAFDTDVEVVELNGTIKMNNIQLTSEGTVYAIAREIGQIVPDPEDDFSTIEVDTRNPRTPTNEQINSCKDWNNEPVDACAKAVIANDDDVNLFLRNLKPNTIYIVYYTTANEYPIQPVFSDEIDSFIAKVLSGELMKYSLTIFVLVFSCLFL